MKIKSLVNTWLSFMCVAGILLFATPGSVCAQGDVKVGLSTDEPLGSITVENLLEELGGKLHDFIDDESRITEITDKWAEHEDLAGKRKKQILEVLLKDVKAVIGDDAIVKKIWDSWNEVPK